jgi:hypothetical protein
VGKTKQLLTKKGAQMGNKNTCTYSSKLVEIQVASGHVHGVSALVCIGRTDDMQDLQVPVSVTHAG